MIELERRPGAERERSEHDEVLEHYRRDRRSRQHRRRDDLPALATRRDEVDECDRDEQRRVDHRAQQHRRRQHREAEQQPARRAPRDAGVQAPEGHAQEPRHHPVIIELLRKEQHGGRRAQPCRDDQRDARTPGEIARERVKGEDAAQRHHGEDEAERPEEAGRAETQGGADQQVEQRRLSMEIPERAEQVRAQQRDIGDLHPARQIVGVEAHAECEDEQPHRGVERDQRRDGVAERPPIRPSRRHLFAPPPQPVRPEGNRSAGSSGAR